MLTEPAHIPEFLEPSIRCERSCATGLSTGAAEHSTDADRSTLESLHLICTRGELATPAVQRRPDATEATAHCDEDCSGMEVVAEPSGGLVTPSRAVGTHAGDGPEAIRVDAAKRTLPTDDAVLRGHAATICNTAASYKGAYDDGLARAASVGSHHLVDELLLEHAAFGIDAVMDEVLAMVEVDPIGA